MLLAITLPLSLSPTSRGCLPIWGCFQDSILVACSEMRSTLGPTYGFVACSVLLPIAATDDQSPGDSSSRRAIKKVVSRGPRSGHYHLHASQPARGDIERRILKHRANQSPAPPRPLP
ncbi:hypothetical protein LX36DRAFT_28586 [Colletotrichum falcatum]|nr:hypothetical protein LX36DRAFT_28586 [Colletotrichum falcatum]